MVGSGPAQSPVIALATRLGKPAIALPTPPTAPIGWSPISARVVSWENDGLAIEGLLYMPVVPTGARVPLVVEAHGGPSNVFSNGYSPLVRLLVAEGWAVLRPNVRGSTGYGPAFLAANRNDLGGGDLRDLLAGIDTVLKRYPVDERRIAMIGYSYGGELAAFAAGKTRRFSAIVAVAPVVDQFSQYGTEPPDTSFYDAWFYGDPWKNFEDAKRQSPVAFASGATTPLLLIHGEADRSVPLGQSQEMLAALRNAGSPVSLVIYPREDHVEIGRNFMGLPSTEPWHGVDLRQRMVTFIRSAFMGSCGPVGRARTAPSPGATEPLQPPGRN